MVRPLHLGNIDMTDNTQRALQNLLDALVSPDCTDAELPAVFAQTAGSGDIIPAIIAARAAIANQEYETLFEEEVCRNGWPLSVCDCC
jgi:hypothetical protein